jgi:sortase (surface protein transpeptidase)
VPFASSLNVNRGGDIRAAAVIAPTPTDAVTGRRTVKIYVLEAAALIVDVTGYFTGPGSGSSQVGLFAPVDPVRILDTREPGQIGRLWPGWTVEGAVPGSGASEGAAAVVNLTGVDSRGEGFLTISAARTPWPGTSNLNFTGPWQVIPNHAITAITATHGFQVFSVAGAHVIVDYLGYYTGSPGIPRIAAPTNPPPPPIGPEWILRIPRLGLTSRVRAGDPNRVTDAGHSWHWTGTGYMGQEAHVAAFGHRTEAGGPYRYVHLLSGGDTFTVSTGDGREYTYAVVRRDLTDARTENILEATRYQPGTTFSLIACTVGYDSSKSAYPDAWAPTSLKYRIIVTGVLVGWREV